MKPGVSLLRQAHATQESSETRIRSQRIELWFRFQPPDPWRPRLVRLSQPLKSCIVFSQRSVDERNQVRIDVFSPCSYIQVIQHSSRFALLTRQRVSTAEFCNSRRPIS